MSKQPVAAVAGFFVDCTDWAVLGYRGKGSHAIPESYRMANVVWLRGRRVKHHYLRDEDHDSPAHCEHDLQQPLHHLRVFWRDIPHACFESGSPAAQHCASASNAEVDKGRGSSCVDRRNIDRLAEAVHGTAHLSQG